ncbi:hypothetical protein HYU95_01695 [Candidatus Daviesbacteria bacterium]|nr:hypothetical protein [Candidatus Daviesbacteria bacterium]
MTNSLKGQSGQILIMVFIALGIVLFTVLFMIGGAQVYFQNASYTANAEKATALAEAGVDKALASLNKTGGSYSGEAETDLGDGSYSVTVTSIDAATKLIEATGYVPNKDQPKTKRTIKINTSRGTGVSFNYGIQVGEGGIELGNRNTISGNVYSNGSVSMGENDILTGEVWVAAGIAPVADQQTNCEGANCTDYLFGRNIGGQDRLDIGMSFRPSVTDKIRKVSLKIKKIGNPADVTVRIMGDDNGKPKKNEVLATGTLFSSLVTGAYGWIDVTFSTNPQLSAGATYWIVIDTSSDLNNYWSWQNDLAQSYNNGQPKWSPNWSTGNPTWNSLAGDLSFQAYMGGTVNSLNAGNNSVIQGDAHANTIDVFQINGDAYYQAITPGSRVGGSFCPNPKCHPGSEDPAPQSFPISDANIASWKSEAEAAGPIFQPTCGSAIPWGPGKYTGNLILNNTCSIKVKTPIFITGDINMGNSNTFTLDSSYGAGSGIIILDGQAKIEGNTNKFLGTGIGNSILVLLTTYDSRTNGNEAIEIGNGSNTGVFYADKGIIEPGNGNDFKEITAWKIKITNDSFIDYDTGLASILFSSGPGGTYSLVRGTYQVK